MTNEPRSIVIYKPREGAPSERLAYEYIDNRLPNGKAIVRPLVSRQH